MECPLPLTEYIVDILITCLKDAMVESPLRNEMIYSVLEQIPTYTCTIFSNRIVMIPKKWNKKRWWSIYRMRSSRAKIVDL